MSPNEDMLVRTATLDSPDQGLPDELLNDTDVLLWWGHARHGQVEDALVDRIVKRVNLENMGFIALHSAHASKPFQRLMGTPTGMLRWREDGDMQRLWVVSPGHPIAEGLGDYFEVPQDETYGEMFYIPQPENLVFISWHPAERCSAPAAASCAAGASSTSSPATRPSPSTTRRKCSRSSPTRCAGPRPRRPPTSTSPAL